MSFERSAVNSWARSVPVFANPDSPTSPAAGRREESPAARHGATPPRGRPAAVNPRSSGQPPPVINKHVTHQGSSRVGGVTVYPGSSVSQDPERRRQRYHHSPPEHGRRDSSPHGSGPPGSRAGSSATHEISRGSSLHRRADFGQRAVEAGRPVGYSSRRRDTVFSDAARMVTVPEGGFVEYESQTVQHTDGTSVTTERVSVSSQGSRRSHRSNPRKVKEKRDGNEKRKKRMTIGEWMQT
ncbi:hypothetical protein JT07_s5gp1 [Cladosporium cladosporioides virus 1]|uniref:Uncharacterized protein n=1 Tax=Cladosporium cladosporioides virus 1 TaxID=1529605 RepID=A0A076JXD6_9VIRU|nr:hypothetical protein JT07_s5gp1 [Cladosporium cladosporioides virus 1]AII80571.1 hypothetical protein [Cladosporium cladosporioides virus 1]